jgi:O-succinylbenzoate synthase
MAWTGLETALVDRQLRAQGRSLAEALGAEPRALDACAVVGLHPDPDATVDAVAGRVAAGYRSVKLKIEPGRDLDRLRAVRAAFPALGLAADANGAYGRDDRDHLVAVAAVGLDYLEQPLARDDLEGLAALAAALPVPVALDESVGSVADLERAVAAGAGSVLNLKPARVGGLAATLAVVAQARDAGWTLFVGGMLETGVGRAVALAVASLDACTWPTDLGPSDRYFAEDVTAPIPLLDGGRLQVPPGPGIGVVPRGVRLDVVTVDRVVVAR